MTVSISNIVRILITLLKVFFLLQIKSISLEIVGFRAATRIAYYIDGGSRY